MTRLHPQRFFDPKGREINGLPVCLETAHRRAAQSLPDTLVDQALNEERTCMLMKDYFIDRDPLAAGLHRERGWQLDSPAPRNSHPGFALPNYSADDD